MLPKIARSADGTRLCTVHETVVASLKDSVLTLNTGGWVTATTARRMNQFLEAMQLPGKVNRKQGVLFLDWKGRSFPFQGSVLRLDTVQDVADFGH